MSAKTEDVSPEPCPFCAGDGVSVTDATRILGVWNLIHRCPVIGPIDLQGRDRDDVVAKWNTRASHAAQAERIASLETAIRPDKPTLMRIISAFTPCTADDGVVCCDACHCSRLADAIISGKASA